MSYLSGMVSIVKHGFELGLATKEIVHFFPTVVIGVHHSAHLAEDNSDGVGQ